MIDELNNAIDDYKGKWQKLTAQRSDKPFFEALFPTSVGYKAVDRTEFDRCVAELQDLCSDVLFVWMNDRWVAKMILREPIGWGIGIVKVLQRRPGSTDVAGFDHVDFYSHKNEAEIERTLAKEDLKWTHEENRTDYTWASIWFDNTEAKIKNYTILDIEMRQLADVNARIKGEK